MAFPSAALAHPLLDQAVASYEEADFSNALSAFVEAEKRTDLTTSDLMTLFEMRALVYHAMGQEDEMRQDLQRLASMRPTHRLGRIAPPSVRDAFDAVREETRGAISIDISAQASPGQLRITAKVKRDITGIGTALRIFTLADRGEWNRADGDKAIVELPDGGEVRYYVELLGPGGAVVTHRGTEADPRLAEVPPLVDTEIIVKEAFKAKVPVSAWVTWVAGAALLAGGGITGGLTLKQDNKLQSCKNNPTGCPKKDVDKADTLALMTDIMLGAGAVSAITGTVIYLVSRKKQKREYEAAQQQALRLEPRVGPGHVGGSLTLQF